MKIKAIITDQRLGNEFPLPEFGTQHSAGIDLRAMLPEPVTLIPGECRLISSGLKIWVEDPGYAALVIPRSGLGAKQGLVIGNLTGLIDADYQGDLMIAAWNRNFTKGQNLVINPGDRIAQLVVVPVARYNFEFVNTFDMETSRGEQGFGHTGI